MGSWGGRISQEQHYPIIEKKQDMINIEKTINWSEERMVSDSSDISIRCMSSTEMIITQNQIRLS